MAAKRHATSGKFVKASGPTKKKALPTFLAKKLGRRGAKKGK